MIAASMVVGVLGNLDGVGDGRRGGLGSVPADRAIFLDEVFDLSNVEEQLKGTRRTLLRGARRDGARWSSWGATPMTDAPSYGSPGAFRRALTDKLRDLAATSRWTVHQLQRQMAYDRLLERLYLVDQGWIIIPRPLADASGVRLPVTAFVGTTVWAAFHVDLVAADLRMTGEPEDVPPLARVVMPDVQQHGYRAYPLVDHVADKVCAIVERHGPAEAPSTRYRDLIDLIAIVLAASADSERQIAALRSEARTSR